MVVALHSWNPANSRFRYCCRGFSSPSGLRCSPRSAYAWFFSRRRVPSPCFFFFASCSIGGYCSSGWISVLDVSFSLKSVIDSLILNNGRQKVACRKPMTWYISCRLDYPSLIVHFLILFCLDTFKLHLYICRLLRPL
jgi:hypothetical protein